MPVSTSNFSEVPLYFAYRRLSVNNEHKETFHSHLGVEILYIHQGSGTMIVNNNSYEIKPGMLCIFQPNQLHHLTLDYSDGQSFERSLAIFEPTMFEAYFENWPGLHAFYRFIYLGQLPSPCLYEIRDARLLDNLFKSMHDRLPALRDTDKHEEISLFLVPLYRCLKQEWSSLNEHPAVYRTRRRNDQVEHILNWIEAHYSEPYSLDEMARSLHLSPFYLSRLFKEATGINISEYIATRRVHQSVLLLTTTNKPVSLIAEEIGLMNSSYFCKLFKSHMGITPHQYRKRWTRH
ncbi:AraC family transcriptional regulator [Paenibacillus nanensis]|uniref:AraC family transcriptional regulator n=1 Tax=Paenibacillus nanensis TaxID=393251 RepID=A0A3A1V234_9BACL|nr:AraC family transcriptional regulator [Paenibacillus nanensis]RIX53891.1 AraC family transcriptional regulator [Paenibacillus nanensis]